MERQDENKTKDKQTDNEETIRTQQYIEEQPSIRLRTEWTDKKKQPWYDTSYTRVTEVYIRNHNTIEDLQELFNFYWLEYTEKYIKEDYVRELTKFAKYNRLNRPDVVWKSQQGGSSIKLTRPWLNVAKDVVKESVHSFVMSKLELHKLILAEIEDRNEKSRSGEYDSDHPKYMSEYAYRKCDVKYRTFMHYIKDNSGYDYSNSDRKSYELVEELNDLIDMYETKQKAYLFKKMVADDTKGRQRYWELISTKDDNWNKTKKVNKKLDWQIQMEEIMGDIMDEQDDLSDNE